MYFLLSTLPLSEHHAIIVEVSGISGANTGLEVKNSRDVILDWSLTCSGTMFMSLFSFSTNNIQLMKDLAGFKCAVFCRRAAKLSFLQQLNGSACRDWALNYVYKNVNCSRRESRQP